MATAPVGKVNGSVGRFSNRRFADRELYLPEWMPDPGQRERIFSRNADSRYNKFKSMRGRSMSESDNPEISLNESHLLLLSAREGDPSALGQLAARLRPYLKRVVEKEAGFAGATHRDDASDLVQQTLLAATENLENFRGTSLNEWRAWLAAIARNQVNKSKRHWRAQRRAQSREIPADWLAKEIAGAADSPSELFQKDEQIGLLQSLLESLAPDQRQLIEWRHRQNLPHAEIANRLGISVAASRQRCKAAMDALKTTWRNAGY